MLLLNVSGYHIILSLRYFRYFKLRRNVVIKRLSNTVQHDYKSQAFSASINFISTQDHGIPSFWQNTPKTTKTVNFRSIYCWNGFRYWRVFHLARNLIFIKHSTVMYLRSGTRTRQKNWLKQESILHVEGEPPTPQHI